MTKYLQRIILIFAAVVFAVLPMTPYGEKDTLTLMISLFTMAGLASSWNILGGFVGRINLGHVAFFGLGALVTRELWLTYEVALPIAFVAGGLAAALAAAIVGAPALRLKGIYFSIGTLALAEALRQTVSISYPKVSRLPGPMLRGYEIVPRYYLSFAVLVVIVIFVAWLSRSKIGLGMMAIREDEEAARSIGINVFFHTMLAFVLSAFFAGLVGGTYAYFHVSYYHEFSFIPIWTFDALIVAFIGGIGTLSGPLLGALFFVMIRDILSNSLVFDIFSYQFRMSDYHLVIFGVIFIFAVIAMPGGILEFFEWLGKRLRPDNQDNS